MTRSSGTFGTLRFDEKSFSKTFLGFTPYRNYRPTKSIHSDNPGVYISGKRINLSTIDEMHLKFDNIDGSVVNGLRQPILYSFDLDKSPGLKVFCESETKHYKKNKQICFEYYSILLRS